MLQWSLLVYNLDAPVKVQVFLSPVLVTLKTLVIPVSMYITRAAGSVRVIIPGNRVPPKSEMSRRLQTIPHSGQRENSDSTPA